MALVGDSINLAFNSGVRFSDTAAQIKYRRIINGEDTIYRYSTNEDSALYIITFSEVGLNKGDYIIDLAPVNGRIYQYVGKGQGDYLPVRLLPVPNKREMMVLGSIWNRTKNTSFYSEVALSNKDANTVSDIGNSDNQGIGTRVGYEIKNKKIDNRYKIDGKLEYQYTSSTFNVLDRIREADFQRDWSSNQDLISEDNIVFSSIGLSSDRGNYVKMENNYRNKIDDVSGFQNRTGWKEEIGRFSVKGSSFFMDNQANDRINQWRKLIINPSFDLSYFKPGYKLNVEKNRLSNDQDSVLSTLMNYEEHNYYIENSDSSNVEFLLNYQFRKDFLPLNGKMEWFDGLRSQNWNDRANTITSNLRKEIGANQNISLTGTYRELETKANVDSIVWENNLLSRLDWNSRYLKRHISSELTYTVNTSRELKREYQYIQWDNYSTATHVWRDNNEDGIQDLDEFFPILNNETQNTFVKFLVPTNEYITAFTNSLNYRLNVNGPNSWRSEEGLKKFVSRFDNLSILSTERKTTNDDFNNRLNPLFGVFDTLDLANSNVLSTRKALRSTLFFNRTDPKYGFELTKNGSSTKQLITNGSDSRSIDGWELSSRLNATRFISFNNKLNLNNNYNKSTYLISRNYDIRERFVEQGVFVQPNNSLRFGSSYSYSIKNGFSLAENSIAETNNLGIEVKVNQLSKRTIMAAFNYISINYDGEQNTPLGYDVMEGLQNGNNFTWQCNIQQRLSNGLNINLMYDGRKSQENQSVHTGRMQVSALF